MVGGWAQLLNSEMMISFFMLYDEIAACISFAWKLSSSFGYMCDATYSTLVRGTKCVIVFAAVSMHHKAECIHLHNHHCCTGYF